MKINFLLLAVAIFVIVFSSYGQETGTFTDSRDGKIYKTVKIGNQTWMAENLNYETESSCCYNFDNSFCNVFGRLYTFEDAQKACPIGWHLPSESEWMTLRDYLGGKDAVNKIRKSGQFGFDKKETNSSGFTALSGGLTTSVLKFFHVVNNGWKETKTLDLLSFRAIHEGAYWWSSNGNGKKGRAFCVRSSSVKIYSNMISKKKHFGMSVRCLKD